MKSELRRKIRLCAFADEADTSLGGQIAALKDNCISLLEIRGVDGENIADIGISKLKDIKKRLDDNEIRIWSIGSPAGKVDIHENFLNEKDKFESLLEKACILEAECIRFFSFYGTQGDAAYSDEVCGRLAEFVTLSDKSGIVPCHENEKGIYGDSIERCLEIHKRINGLRAVFDPANFIQCGQNVPRAWETLADFVYYGHIKDALTDGTVVLPGKGEGHIDRYIDDFAARGCSVLTLEPHLAEFVGLSGLENEDGKSIVGGTFKDNREAFDCAVTALKRIINED